MGIYANEVQKLYTAFFNRPADPIGLAYWEEQITKNGGSTAVVANAFSASAEYKAMYDGKSTAQIIDTIYQNLFGRAAEADGLVYWGLRLENGTFNIGNIAVSILVGAQGDDKKVIENKIVVATAFTTALDTAAEIVAYSGSTAAEAARTFMKTVGATDASLTAAKAAVATTVSTIASTTVANGTTYTLTQGLDTITGTSANDTIKAFAFNSVTGADTTTLNSVDTIDGGAGIDSLYIEVKDHDAAAGTADMNDVLQGTIKNVEVITIDNTSANSAAAVDASLFVGATSVTQLSKAGTISKLDAATIAGFKAVTAAMTVAPADAAAKATVALDGVDEGLTLNVTATATGTLNSVVVSGTVKDTDASGTVADTTVAVTVGKDVETVSVNTGVATTLTVTDNGAKKVSSVQAFDSTGAITYVGAATVGAITTGAGKDTVDLKTAYTATLKAASVGTGAGDDTINLLVTNAGSDVLGATVSASAGDGDDTIKLDTTAGATNAVGVTINGGAGKDKVTLTDGIDSIATTDVIDGGDGTDTVSLAGKTLDAEDYIILKDVIKNFEAVDFTTSAASVDASRMAAYKSFSFAGAAGTITKVAADQALTTTIGLTATASGYVLDSDADIGGNQTTYAGTLNITAKAGVTVTANAEAVNLTVTPVTDKDGAVDNTSVTLVGDAKTVNVTLNATTDTKNTTVTTDDVLETSTLVLTNAAANAALTSLTITGNGSATVTNAASKKLVTVDASGLNSVDVAGKAVAGLNYTSSNASAETIKLGGGLDVVTLTSSSVLKADTIVGLSLVDDAAVTGTQIDATKSDDLVLKSNDGTLTLGTFEKITTVTGATLDLVLVNLAASATKDKVVFQFGGDTYVYGDLAADGTAGDNVVNDADVLVKLVGSVDLDLLVSALG